MSFHAAATARTIPAITSIGKETLKVVTKLATYVGFPDMYNSATESATTAQWNSLVSAMGQAPTMMLTYVDKTHPVSQWVSDQQWAVGSWKATPWLATVTPVIGLPMAVNGDNADQDFRAIASGSWDQTINGVFKTWTDAGHSSFYLRPGWEMNGDWYPWAVTNSNAADFAAAFRHIADLAHNFSGASITVVWNPNVGNPSSQAVPVSNYYPGDSYVDVVGIDTYGAPLDSDTSPYNTANGPADFTLTAAAAFAKAHGKPLALAETGGTDATFPANLASVVSSTGVTVDFVGLWDVNDGESGNLSWSQNTTDSAAWRNALATISNTVVPPPPPPPPPPPVTTPDDTLVLNLSEDYYKGNAQAQLLIDGQKFGSPITVTARHSSGQVQHTNVSLASIVAGLHTIGVQFVNDKYHGSPSTDRNLYVNPIQVGTASGSSVVNATTYGSGTTALLGTGDTATFTNVLISH